MDYLQGLLDRRSMPLLQDPAPTQVQLENMLQAALRAPDHGNLKPFRFVTISGDARQRLGEVFMQRQLERDPNTDSFTQEKFRNMPMRAPMLLCLIASPVPHPKAPELEQIQSAACAGQNILHAAHAQGLGAVWRTGWLAEDPTIIAHLGLQGHEKLLGFLYLGTPKCPPRQVDAIDTQSFLTDWQGSLDG